MNRPVRIKKEPIKLIPDSQLGEPSQPNNLGISLDSYNVQQRRRTPPRPPLNPDSPTYENEMTSSLLEQWEKTLEQAPNPSINGISGHERRSAQVTEPIAQCLPNGPKRYRSLTTTVAPRPSTVPIDRPTSAPPQPLPVSDAPTNENQPLTEGVTTRDPRDIYNIQQSPKEVLFLDLRSRERWRVERVTGLVVCVEPTFAVHDLTAERITFSLELSPKKERLIFENRHQFPLVVLYEEHGPTELSEAVAKALWDTKVKEEVKLKRAPVLMNGGFKRWKEDVGNDGIFKISSTVAGNLYSLPQRRPIYPIYPESVNLSSRTGASSLSRPLPVPATGPLGPSRDRLWVPLTSFREEEYLRRSRRSLLRPPSPAHLPNAPLSGFDQVGVLL
jgi:hypothetical protein